MTTANNVSGIEFAACTIVAKNYLPMARVLADSWNRFHPEFPIFVLFLDSPKGFFSIEREAFQSVLMSDLDIPNINGFLFKYSILEASTAVKPYFLNHLFAKYRIDKLLYLDPDILILNSLQPLRTYLDSSNILLTPHLLSPIPSDGRRQTEHDILKSGVYNLGFLGLRNGVEADRLLRWWSDKLYHHCMVAIEENLFVDQRWMDLVPGLFDGVRIIRDPGYNVAYWNLHERSVSLNGRVTVNGEGPLHFLHFSGFDADKPWIVSKHQDRYGMTNIGELYQLYLHYRDLLVQRGWEEAKQWNYSHDYFRSGMKIPRAARRYYWSLGPNTAHLGDPFSWLDDKDEAPQQAVEPAGGLLAGINLIGHFEAETGVGEGARSNLRIIEAAGIPHVVNNSIDSRSVNIENLPRNIAEHSPFSTNLLTINADEMGTYARNNRERLRNRFNIGYWAWEVPEFPTEWARSFGYVDEIWTPSHFTRDAVMSCSPVPVRVVPHCMQLSDAPAPAIDRSSFGLDPHAFTFLFFFDFDSYFERKNPLGLIRAFAKAFGNRRDVQLLIKSVHGDAHPEELSLLQTISSSSNVRILDRVLPRQQKQALMMAADCYISLHRSEGFGLTLAEAMLYGKPVIATAYSGNVDFMSDADSFLVPYRLVTIQQTCGPYKAGYHWADPDLDSAIDIMRHVQANHDSAIDTGLKAQEKIQRMLHPATIAGSVRARMRELGLWTQVAEVAAQ